MNHAADKTAPPLYPAELVEQEHMSEDFKDRLYHMMFESTVRVAKGTDDLLFGAVKQVLTEHGIRNEYVLNEDFIVAAIREKMERGAAAHWVDTGETDDDGNRVVRCSGCSHRDKQSPSIPVPYCWYCGAKMQNPKGD